MRIKLDENLGQRWAGRLRSAGHDVHTVWDEGLSGATDVDLLAAAVAEQRLLVSLDLDFANPMRFPPAHTAGIAIVRIRDRSGQADLDALIERLVITLVDNDPTGELWIVEHDRVRRYEEPAD